MHHVVHVTETTAGYPVPELRHAIPGQLLPRMRAGHSGSQGLAPHSLMRRVYQQGWRKTLLKHFMLISAYSLVFISFMILTMGSSAYLLDLSEQHPWILGWLVG